MAKLAPGGIMDLVSTKGTRFKELAIAEKNLSETEWLALLEQEPKLLRRPLVTDGEHLVIGYDEQCLQGLEQ
jgi:arsenate reductase-like glutaredoxin family protein